MFSTELSLAEATHAIATIGKSNTIVLEGEPGIGKSAILKAVKSILPEYTPAYIDCTLLDLGDIAMPKVIEENGMPVTTFAPNRRFGFHLGKPVIIMLDEIGKAMKSVKNVMLTLTLEHRIGDHYLPEGSIVFATTNLASDKVGDSLEAHARNRVCFVKVKKPDAPTWLKWAVENNIAPEVMTWVHQFPHCLASYTEGDSQAENNYIFNPAHSNANRRAQAAFVTPRSLEKASNIIKQRATLGDRSTLALLSGTIGGAAAMDMKVYIEVVDKIPSYNEIIAHPDTAKLPTDVVARFSLVFGSVMKTDAKNMGAFLTYMQRLGDEETALYARSLMTSTRLQPLAMVNESFNKYIEANHIMF